MGEGEELSTWPRGSGGLKLAERDIRGCVVLY